MDGGTDAGLLVLHGLRLSGFTTSASIAERWGLDASVVDDQLAAFREAGWANFREGRLTGWMLSTEGRVEGERRLSAELDRADARATLERAYDHFLPLNLDFLAVCTDWQLREVAGEQVINDHSDPEHDRGVVERLVVLHGNVVGVLEQVERADAAVLRVRPAFARVRSNGCRPMTLTGSPSR